MILAIQDTGIPNNVIEDITSKLDEFGANYFTFGLIPFSNKIVYDNISPNVFPYGSVQLAKLFLEQKLPKRWKFYYNLDAFDFRYQVRLFGDELLNSVCRIDNYTNVKDATFDQPVFVKPVNDLKLFSGFVLEQGKTLSQHFSEITLSSTERLDGSTIIVSQAKTIDSEARFFIHGDRIISGANYKPLNVRGSAPSPDIVAYVQSIINAFTPSEFFVVDVCKTANGPRIVEFNCLHCAGFYGSMQAHDVLKYLSEA